VSAIGGIYNFDGGRVDQAAFLALAHGLKTRAPDGGTQVHNGPVAMAYRAFHTDRESQSQGQPLVSSHGHILCWDGRLDNREELISNLRNDLSCASADVSIVMAVYLRWGSDVLPKLIGDYAFSLWDPFARSLILARDFIGPRTLFYHVAANRITWSTELAGLVKVLEGPLELNDEYVAGFLTNLPEPGLTPYTGIHAVPPGSVVTVTHGRIRTRRIWAPNPSREIRYRSDAEYEEHFRQLFREGVQCRLRVDGEVWSELSGGLDSSSVVCMAADLIKRGECGATGLQTVSMVFDEASKCDERRYIEPVEEKIAQKGLHLREDDHRILTECGEEYVPTIPSFPSNFIAYYRTLNRTMSEAGARVLLTGRGADEVLSGGEDPFPELANLLVDGRLLQLHQRLQIWSKALSRPYRRLLWQNLITPLLPHQLQRARRRGLKQVLKFFNADFVKRMDLADRLFGPPEIFGFRRPGARRESTNFLCAPRELSGGFWSELCSFEFSYPFTHRPLVEFMLAIPPEQKARPYERKSILRRALRDLLPVELVNRTEGRITNLQAMVYATRRERERLKSLFDGGLAASYEYLDSNALLTALNSNNASIAHVISFAPFEYWLRSLHKRNLLQPRHSPEIETMPAPIVSAAAMAK
jgi:asparagine synthase (glutamine-hydrolysing)